MPSGVQQATQAEEKSSNRRGNQHRPPYDGLIYSPSFMKLRRFEFLADAGPSDGPHCMK